MSLPGNLLDYRINYTPAFEIKKEFYQSDAYEINEKNSKLVFVKILSIFTKFCSNIDTFYNDSYDIKTSIKYKNPIVDSLKLIYDKEHITTNRMRIVHKGKLKNITPLDYFAIFEKINLFTRYCFLKELKITILKKIENFNIIYDLAGYQDLENSPR